MIRYCCIRVFLTYGLSSAGLYITLLNMPSITLKRVIHTAYMPVKTRRPFLVYLSSEKYHSIEDPVKYFQDDLIGKVE